jgi:hypothetical protein
MARLYLADEQPISFSSSAAGKWFTPTISIGSGRWGITIHNLPPNPGLKVEVNNRRLRLPGFEGVISPVNYGLLSPQQSVKGMAVSADPSFSAYWVTMKPESEFRINGSDAIVSSDTGGGNITGMFRFLRLSMTASPSATTVAFFFDESNVLYGG